MMRRAIMVAAALVAPLVLSATGAQAEEWCGYATHENAIIECGYTTVADCETAVGKGGMCFIDPELALETKRAKILLPARFSPLPSLTAAAKRL
jgi:hypothetical protein